MTDTYWQDLGNEIFDGIGTVGGRVWKEATFRPDSWNQQACEGVADILTIGAASGVYTGRKIEEGYEAVSDWGDRVRSFDYDGWPSARRYAGWDV